MSGIWVVLEERDGRISSISWEAVAAGQKLAALTGLAVNAVVMGAQTEALGRRGCKQSTRQSGSRGASAAGGVHGRWIHSRPAAILRKREPHASGLSAHLPGARLCSGAGCAAGSGADRRCDRHWRRPRLHAATDARPAEWLLPAHGRRAVLCLGAGGSVSGRHGSKPARRRSLSFRPQLKRRRFAPSPASLSAARRRRSILARRS